MTGRRTLPSDDGVAISGPPSHFRGTPADRGAWHQDRNRAPALVLTPYVDDLLQSTTSRPILAASSSSELVTGSGQPALGFLLLPETSTVNGAPLLIV